uniref:Uncharacterized protein n=1 Tax=Oncorhynchus mykiss TaxID=8022 RepID=A0A8C7SQU8_ONCMY
MVTFVSKKLLFVLPLTNPLDEVGIRIDDLEKNVTDLMTQAGLEEHFTESCRTTTKSCVALS